MKLGRNLARTFLDYYKLQNIIVFSPSSTLVPKLNSAAYLNLKSPTNTSPNQQNNANSNSSKSLNNTFGSSGSISSGMGGINKKKAFQTSSTLQSLKPSSYSVIANSPSSMSNGSVNNDSTNGKTTTAKFFLDNELE